MFGEKSPNFNKRQEKKIGKNQASKRFKISLLTWW